MADIKHIWNLFINGDDRLFNQLYKYYYPSLYKNAFYIMKDKELAMTVVQDSFIKLWNHRNQLKTIENQEAYLMTICKNNCVDLLRRKAIQFVQWEEQQEDASYLQADNNLHYRETEKLLRHSLAQLTDRQRQIYDLSRDQGYSYNDIGNQLNLSPATVKKHMSVILQKLRRHLNAIGISVLLCTLFPLN